jgi:AbrB family looped-hinge helix DNA binding protein
MSVDIEATVSERGQVVIPKAIREAFDLKPGTTVTFRVEDDGIVIRNAENALEEFLGAVDKQPEPDGVDWDDRHAEQFD